VKDVFSWRRSTDFEHVKAEVKAVRDSVGMMEISGFCKFGVTGPGARDWLDKMLACKIPNPGRMTLAPMLKNDGKLIGDLSIACVKEGDFFLAGSGMAEVYYRRWFENHMPDDGSVVLDTIGLGLTGLSIAGPNARKVLEKITHADVSAQGFRFMAIREMELGFAPCLVGRVSFTGDLGFEIWMKPEYQRHIFDEIMEAGSEFGIKLFGLRALNAMRLEKNFGGWAREYRPLYGPLEAGLERFVAYAKPADFIGKEAAIVERDCGGTLRLKMFTLGARDADVIGDEPIWLGGEVVGWVTSGGYAHNSGASMALGYIPKEHANADGLWQIELLGERLAAQMQHAPIWDANAERMRG
jgi:dimethylglycine dehydrogenase